MNKVFNYHLKKRVLTSINWKNFFIEWQNQKSNFIEITQKLKEIYPVGYIIKDRKSFNFGRGQKIQIKTKIH
ncbi:unnamed protein product [Rhizophagus irregularis]|nr:unnamed protein product [Rhizophagus irregularis]CAB5382186.1 unnamed protein product [Rhizophagus irregularis]